MRDKCLESTVLWLFFIYFDSFDIGYFVQPCNIGCSMQHVVSTPSTYPGSCKSCFSCIPVFGRKVFLIFSIIYQMVDLKLICIIGQPELINSLIFANIYPGWHIYSLWWFLFQLHGQLALKFHWDKTCLYFELLLTLLTLQNYIEITWSVMPVFWASFDPFDITKLHWNYLISHAKTILFDDCAGGSQGVQLLDWSNMSQVWAIRLRRVWGSWYPSI